MPELNIPLALFVSFGASLISTFILRYVALKVNLVDTPNHRKNHAGRIPLVGGISIFVGVVTAFSFFPDLGRELTAYLVAAMLIVTIGLLDDQFDLKVRYRLLMQFTVSLVIIFGGDISIKTLGVFGSQEGFQLGWFSLPFTIFSIMVAINSFNFVDGIDGLSGLLFMIAVLSIIMMCAMQNGSSVNNYLIPLLFFVAIIPYMAFNLSFFGSEYRVFLGDAGSMLLGLTVAWLLIHYTQVPGSITFSPVTALWIIAVPLMDMLAIVVRRARNGKAPFHPDRKHLHHLFMDKGMSDQQALIVISFLALVFAGMGIVGELAGVSHTIMLIAFLLLFAAYYRIMARLSG